MKKRMTPTLGLALRMATESPWARCNRRFLSPAATLMSFSAHCLAVMQQK